MPVADGGVADVEDRLALRSSLPQADIPIAMARLVEAATATERHRPLHARTSSLRINPRADLSRAALQKCHGLRLTRAQRPRPSSVLFGLKTRSAAADAAQAAKRPGPSRCPMKPSPLRWKLQNFSDLPRSTLRPSMR